MNMMWRCYISENRPVGMTWNRHTVKPPPNTTGDHFLTGLVVEGPKVFDFKVEGQN